MNLNEAYQAENFLITPRIYTLEAYLTNSMGPELRVHSVWFHENAFEYTCMQQT